MKAQQELQASAGQTKLEWQARAAQKEELLKKVELRAQGQGMTEDMVALSEGAELDQARVGHLV